MQLLCPFAHCHGYPRLSRMFHRALAYSLLPAVSTLVLGCHVPLNPARYVNPKYPPELEKCVETNAPTISAAAASDKVTKRNHAVETVRQKIKHSYMDYEASMYVGRASFETITDLISLGLTGATAVVGDAATKAALGASATGITGAHGSVVKNFFEDRSRDAVFTVIKADRKVVLDRINNSLSLPYEQYSIDKACSDLEDLYEAGTVMNAYDTIAAAAAVAPTTSDQVIQALATTTITANEDLKSDASRINIAVANGVVKLTGKVTNSAERTVLDNLVSGIQGVKAVQDTITVDSTPVGQQQPTQNQPGQNQPTQGQPPQNQPSQNQTTQPVQPQVNQLVQPNSGQVLANPATRIQQAIQAH